MPQNIRNFIRKNENIVLLVCDYYQTKQIPIELTSKKDNLALFPVANIPLIDYILKSLISKRLTNIILCGENVERIAEHVSEFFDDSINFISIGGFSSLGDILRHMYDVVYDLKDFLVLYANHYTNIDLKLVFDEHRDNGNEATFFIHENLSNAKVNYFYGTKNKEIVYYDRVVNDKINSKKIDDVVEEHQSVIFNYLGSSPNLAVISPKVFQLFNDNFDFRTLGDFLESTLAFNPYNLKLGFFRPCNILLPSLYTLYSREILTLFDYQQFTEDTIRLKLEDLSKFIQNEDIMEANNNYFFEDQEGFTIENTENTVLGHNNKLQNTFFITDSSIGNDCIISGNIKNCIIWDDISITEDLEGFIVFGNNDKFDVYYLKVEIEIEEVVEGQSNFFDDLIEYLDEVDMEDDLDDIIRQINLMKIFWNASNLDFIEVFVKFLLKNIDASDLEMTTINASAFFPLLQGSVTCAEEQEEVLAYIYNLMLNKDVEVRKEVLFRFGYLLIEDGIIAKPVLKKYNKMVKKGNF